MWGEENHHAKNKYFEAHIIYLKAVYRILHNTRSWPNWIQLSVFLSVCVCVLASFVLKIISLNRLYIERICGQQHKGLGTRRVLASV